jgi:hypothetical protein
MACFGRDGRNEIGDRFKWHPTTGPDVDERDGHVFVNNLLAAGDDFSRPLLFVWQPAFLCEQLNKPQLKQLDYNVYVRGDTLNESPLILWSPAANEICQLALSSPEALHNLYPVFSGSSKCFDAYNGPLFKCYELGNYQLMKAFPGSGTAAALPPEISVLLGRKKKDGLFTGAYLPIP